MALEASPWVQLFSNLPLSKLRMSTFQNMVCLGTQTKVHVNEMHLNYIWYLDIEKPKLYTSIFFGLSWLANMEADLNTPNSFRYKPITSPNSIRILKPRSSTTSSSKIRCIVIHTTLSECGQDLVDGYITLPYVWGAQDNLQQTFLDEKPFYFTQNLSDAFHNLRQPKEVVKLWVDVICLYFDRY